MRVWSAEEVRRFLERTGDDDHHPLWRLMLQTGMRRGEALGLRWRDLDLDRARLSVRQQLVRAGAAVAFGPPKTAAGRRQIALDKGTVAVLKAHKAAQREERLRWGPAYKDGDLVFCRPDGHPHDVDVISQRWDASVARAGVARIRLHDARHTHATLLLQAGVPVKVVSERLGHSKTSLTQDVYQHVIPGMQEDAAARIGAVIDGWTGNASGAFSSVLVDRRSESQTATPNLEDLAPSPYPTRAGRQ
jgi:integrase